MLYIINKNELTPLLFHGTILFPLSFYFLSDPQET
jgi:hypothetical protein